MTPPTPEDIRKSDNEYADKLRALIRHENEVANHRVTWLMVTEGLLVTAVASSFKETLWAAAGLAVIGALVAVSVGHSLQNSFNSRKHFKELWGQRIKDRKYKENDVLPLDGGYTGNKAIKWLLPDKFIPKLIVIAWLCFLFYTAVQGLYRQP